MFHFLSTVQYLYWISSINMMNQVRFFVEKNNFELSRVKLLKKMMMQVNFKITFQQDPILLCAFKIVLLGGSGACPSEKVFFITVHFGAF